MPWALLAKALGIEHLAVHITIGGMTATAQAGGETVTLAREVAPLGVDASRIAALERLARTSKPGLTPEALAAEIDAIEATPRAALPAADRARRWRSPRPAFPT